MTIEPARQRFPAFEHEIHDAIRYERALVAKAAAVLVVVAIIVVLRTLYFALLRASALCILLAHQDRQSDETRSRRGERACDGERSSRARSRWRSPLAHCSSP